MRRTPIGFQAEEDKLEKKMLASGVLKESYSDWASPSVLVRKKNGSVRWCIDFRAVNAVTTKDVYLLPDRPTTAFLTKHGLFQFARMPFGLCNSPSTFQRVVHLVF